MAGTNPKIADSIAREATSLLYSHSLAGILVSMGAISMLTFAPNNPQAIQTKMAIWSVMMLVLMVRLADYVLWRIKYSTNDMPYNAKTATKRFSFGCLVTAVIWSLYAVAMFDLANDAEFAATMIVICAMAGGATSVLAANKRTSILYSLILLIPVSLYALQAADPIRNMLGLLGLIYGIVISFTAAKLSDFTLHAIKLKNENALLLDMMHDERQEVERVNREVKKANAKLDSSNANLEAEVKRRTEELYRISSVEPLTGLTNRSAFTQHLRDMVEQANKLEYKFCLMMVNVDGFKTINDTLGHKVGDAILIEIGRRLKMFSQPQHIGRWGGDEFVITLPYSDANSAASVAKAIKSSLQQSMEIMSNQVSLTVSIGIVMFPDHSEDPLELVQMADITVNAHKHSDNPSPRLFTQDLYAQKRDEQCLKDGLQSAIANKQLNLLYQPIIDTRSGSVWSYEALLRWQFNDRQVFPDVFIPLAEQSGLIREIGAWVLHRACIDASQWYFAEKASVSVNVSVIQLMDDNFETILDSALQTSGLAPERLHLELTESVFADNKEQIIRQINAIKARKVHISIDDFGTGYSSLSQLQSLNFDHIKIDRSFVQQLEQGNQAIISATLFIARELGCVTVAEGIETAEMADMLTAMGADTLQGYWFSKPIPNSELANWQQQHEERYQQHNIGIV